MADDLDIEAPWLMSCTSCPLLGGNAGMTRTNMLPSTGHENNIAQPRTDKWLISPAHFHRLSPFYCCLSIVL